MKTLDELVDKMIDKAAPISLETDPDLILLKERDLLLLMFQLLARRFG